MNTPANLKYTKSDEWFDPASGAMGLTDYAQSQLSDIVFVEILVDEGDIVEAGGHFIVGTPEQPLARERDQRICPDLHHFDRDVFEEPGVTNTAGDEYLVSRLDHPSLHKVSGHAPRVSGLGTCCQTE